MAYPKDPIVPKLAAFSGIFITTNNNFIWPLFGHNLITASFSELGFQSIGATNGILKVRSCFFNQTRV
jgi:hypothetical protein